MLTGPKFIIEATSLPPVSTNARLEIVCVYILFWPVCKIVSKLVDEAILNFNPFAAEKLQRVLLFLTDENVRLQICQVFILSQGQMVRVNRP